MYGLTDQPVDSLLLLEKSWNDPPELKVRRGGLKNQGYDRAQRAYVLERHETGKSGTFEFELAAGNSNPVVNPAFVIRNWGDVNVKADIHGDSISPDAVIRTGRVRTLKGTDLIIWIKAVSVENLRLLLNEMDEN